MRRVLYASAVLLALAIWPCFGNAAGSCQMTFPALVHTLKAQVSNVTVVELTPAQRAVFISHYRAQTGDQTKILQVFSVTAPEHTVVIVFVSHGCVIGIGRLTPDAFQKLLGAEA